MKERNLMSMSQSEFATRLGAGYLLEDLQDACREVAAAVIRTGQKGTVTLTLTIEQAIKGDIAVSIGEKIAKRPPVEPARGAMLYIDDDGFHRQDPRQDQIAGFREVDLATGEIHEPPAAKPAREVGQ